mmetsp:Transcript_3868/g.12831  ORF Transcript_3868/g.12831 Transcript_3868/m.12831 type:complete len:400 (-) Transcript_3868:54-1253(-)
MLKLSLALNLLYFAESTAYRAPNLGRLGRGRLGITTASGDGAASVLRTTRAASMSARTTAIRAEKPTALLHAAALGAGTACMGTLYARCLRFAVTLVWRRLPAALPLADATLFVPAACTVGGLLVGLTALRLQGYTMPELIARYQDEAGAPGGASPAASVLPVLLLSLLTSTFGFSVGPEAPMVVAGSLVGAAYARRVYGAGEHAMARTMAYAGAAGALTTFIGMPLAGALFVLELTRLDAEHASPTPTVPKPIPYPHDTRTQLFVLELTTLDAEHVFMSPNQRSRDTHSAALRCTHCLPVRRAHAVLWRHCTSTAFPPSCRRPQHAGSRAPRRGSTRRRTPRSRPPSPPPARRCWWRARCSRRPRPSAATLPTPPPSTPLSTGVLSPPSPSVPGWAAP